MMSKAVMLILCSLLVLSCGGENEQPAVAEIDQPTTEPAIEQRQPEDEATTSEESSPNAGLTPTTLDVAGDGIHIISIELPDDVSPDNGGRFGIDIQLGSAWNPETVVKLDARCNDDDCSPQDWSKIIDDSSEPLGRARSIMVPDRDEAIDGGWIISGPFWNEDNGAQAVIARWDNDADRYFTCHAEPAPDDADRLDELVAICMTAEPMWFE